MIERGNTLDMIRNVINGFETFTEELEVTVTTAAVAAADDPASEIERALNN